MFQHMHICNLENEKQNNFAEQIFNYLNTKNILKIKE